jgi:hypothetical protein
MKGHPSRNNIFSEGKIGFLQRLVHHFRNSAGDNVIILPYPFLGKWRLSPVAIAFTPAGQASPLLIFLF